VVGQQGSQSAAQRGQVHLGPGEQQHGGVEVLGVRRVMLEEPLLHRGQRRRSGDDPLFSHDVPRTLERDQQRLDGGVFEELARAELDARLFGAGDNLQAEDGFAAQLEVVVADADPRHAQRLRPDRSQLRLGLIARGYVGRFYCQPALVGRRERLAVDLAMRGQREGVEHDKRCGHHVIGQLRGQEVAQLAQGRCRSAVGHAVGHQAFVAGGVLPGQHDGLTDAGMLRQQRLDLAQLDAEAANLHLVVDAPQVFDVAVGQIARQVAGTVEVWQVGRFKVSRLLVGQGITFNFQPGTCNRFKGVSHEPFRGQLRPVEVAGRHARAAHDQLAGDADGDRLQVGIHDIHPQVGDGHADDAAFAGLDIGQA